MAENPVHPALLPAVQASVQQVAASLHSDPATLSPDMAAFIDLLHSLRAGLDTATEALAQLAGAVDGKAAAAAVATLTATVAQHTAAIAGKLSKAGDTATGSIMMPAATAAAAAPRLDQTYGGLNSPIRFASGITATATAGQQAMLPGPLTDPTPQGRKAKPMQVFLTMRAAPAAAATVRVGTTPGGAEVYTRTFLLTALPGLNVLLDPGTAKFAELPAGTVLYLSCTGGTWDAEVFSYYKS